MNVSKRSITFLILLVLLLTLVTGCSVFQNSGKPNAGTAKNLLTSDYAVIELGNIWLFDEKNSTVGILYILRPGPSTEYNKYYDLKILWGEYVLSDMSTRFLSPEDEREETIGLGEEAANQFIKLLKGTSEYQKLQRELEKVREEQIKLRDKEDEMKYNLFWKGEVPSYDETKKIAEQVKAADSREKEIIQKLNELPYTARLPSSFVNSLELIVEAK